MRLPPAPEVDRKGKCGREKHGRLLVLLLLVMPLVLSVGRRHLPASAAPVDGGSNAL